MRLRDLVTDPGTGMLSHTKMWSHVAYAAATAAFLYETWQGRLTEWHLLIYLGVVAGNTTVSKVLSLRFGGAAKPPEAR